MPSGLGNETGRMEGDRKARRGLQSINGQPPAQYDGMSRHVLWPVLGSKCTGDCTREGRANDAYSGDGAADTGCGG